MKAGIFGILIFLNVAFVNAQVNLDSSLVLYLPFNGNANDSSGYNNNGSVTGAALTSDKNGNMNSAYYFNGLSSYITVNNDSSLNPTFYTISSIVQPQDFYAGNCQGNVIMWKGRDADAGHYGLIFSDNPYDNSCATFDSLHANFYNDQGYFATTTDTPFIQSNQWYCLVSTYDGDSVKMYVDGILRYTVHSPQTGINSQLLSIGRNPFDALFPYWYKGVIDEVRIYSRVINNSELNAICSLTNGVIEADHFNAIKLNYCSSENVYKLVFNRQFDNVILSIHNLLGQKIYTAKIPRVNASSSKTIDIKLLNTGIYIIKLIADGNEISFKLIK